MENFYTDQELYEAVVGCWVFIMTGCIIIFWWLSREWRN